MLCVQLASFWSVTGLTGDGQEGENVLSKIFIDVTFEVNVKAWGLGVAFESVLGVSTTTVAAR